MPRKKKQLPVDIVDDSNKEKLIEPSSSSEDLKKTSIKKTSKSNTSSNDNVKSVKKTKAVKKSSKSSNSSKDDEIPVKKTKTVKKSSKSSNSSKDVPVKKTKAVRKTKKTSKSSDSSKDDVIPDKKTKLVKKTKKTSKSTKKSTKKSSKSSTSSNSIKHDKPKIPTNTNLQGTKPKKNDSNKKSKNDKEYDRQFNELKDKYIDICKITYNLQLQLNEKDNEREELLKQIRKLQYENFPNLNFTNVLGKELISNNNDVIMNTELINADSVKLSIKKPLRQTDMETDDSDSEDDFSNDDDDNSSESDSE